MEHGDRRAALKLSRDRASDTRTRTSAAVVLIRSFKVVYNTSF